MNKEYLNSEINEINEDRQWSENCWRSYRYEDLLGEIERILKIRKKHQFELLKLQNDIENLNRPNLRHDNFFDKAIRILEESIEDAEVDIRSCDDMAYTLNEEIKRMEKENGFDVEEHRKEFIQ
jgi:hypothetical protein